MEPQDVERRLTTILSADVVGYSRLMGVDEAGTLAALKAHRKELIEPKEAQYHGRTVKLMGDGVLMEFGSVVAAVVFAVEVQGAMRERNADVLVWVKEVPERARAHGNLLHELYHAVDRIADHVDPNHALMDEEGSSETKARTPGTESYGLLQLRCVALRLPSRDRGRSRRS